VPEEVTPDTAIQGNVKVSRNTEKRENSSGKISNSSVQGFPRSAGKEVRRIEWLKECDDETSLREGNKPLLVEKENEGGDSSSGTIAKRGKGPAAIDHLKKLNDQDASAAAKEGHRKSLYIKQSSRSRPGGRLYLGYHTPFWVARSKKGMGDSNFMDFRVTWGEKKKERDAKQAAR